MKKKESEEGRREKEINYVCMWVVIFIARQIGHFVMPLTELFVEANCNFE